MNPVSLMTLVVQFNRDCEKGREIQEAFLRSGLQFDPDWLSGTTAPHGYAQMLQSFLWKAPAIDDVSVDSAGLYLAIVQKQRGQRVAKQAFDELSGFFRWAFLNGFIPSDMSLALKEPEIPDDANPGRLLSLRKRSRNE